MVKNELFSDSEIGPAASYILDIETAATTSNLAEYIRTAGVTKEDVVNFVRLTTSPEDSAKLVPRADTLWSGLIALKPAEADFFIPIPPRLGKITDIMGNYLSLQGNVRNLSAATYLGPSWNDKLVTYCIAFTTHKTEELTHAYSLLK